MQWFLKMADMAKPALDVVNNEIVKFHPDKFKNTYRHWMENVRDWCISRQLWWGQRIPAFYLPDGSIIVARSAEEALGKALAKFPKITLAELRQDEDVLDTWFSSWLWPISVFDGIRNPENEDIKYYYPTNDLVTAPEILFFWVARMIMAGQEYRKDIPFKNVYLTGIVRDKLGRKMSKSLGNSPDPIKLIEQYGADGVRVGMLLTAPGGNGLPFDESLCEQGRNFSNKVWNAFRLIKGWEVDKSLQQPMYAALSVTWFRSRFYEALSEINDHYDKYRLSDALMGAYKLVWDDFCSWFLEMIKPAYQQPIDGETYKAAVKLFSDIMQVLHPFMPFITEEIWHLLHEDSKGSIMISQMPKVKPYDEKILTHFTYTLEIVTSIRTIRKDKNIPIKDQLDLFILKPSKEIPNLLFDSLIEKLCNLSPIRYVTEKVTGASSFLIKGNEFYVPLGDKIDAEAEIEKLNLELEYTRGFLKSVMVKLSNERFVANAKPEIVDVERHKMNDAELKIKTIEEQILMLKK